MELILGRCRNIEIYLLIDEFYTKLQRLIDYGCYSIFLYGVEIKMKLESNQNLFVVFVGGSVTLHTRQHSNENIQDVFQALHKLFLFWILFYFSRKFTRNGSSRVRASSNQFGIAVVDWRKKSKRASERELARTSLQCHTRM